MYYSTFVYFAFDRDGTEGTKGLSHVLKRETDR
jgi:hypothetical protein